MSWRAKRKPFVIPDSQYFSGMELIVYSTTTIGPPQTDIMSIPEYADLVKDMPLDYNSQSAPKGNAFILTPVGAPSQPQPPGYSVPVLSEDYSEPRSAPQWLTV